MGSLAQASEVSGGKWRKKLVWRDYQTNQDH